jgi:hypothetical protein
MRKCKKVHDSDSQRKRKLSVAKHQDKTLDGQSGEMQILTVTQRSRKEKWYQRQLCERQSHTYPLFGQRRALCGRAECQRRRLHRPRAIVTAITTTAAITIVIATNTALLPCASARHRRAPTAGACSSAARRPSATHWSRVGQCHGGVRHGRRRGRRRRVMMKHDARSEKGNELCDGAQFGRTPHAELDQCPMLLLLLMLCLKLLLLLRVLSTGIAIAIIVIISVTQRHSRRHCAHRQQRTRQRLQHLVAPHQFVQQFCDLGLFARVRIGVSHAEISIIGINIGGG